MPAISHRKRLTEEIQANPRIAVAYNPAAGDTTAPNLGALPGVPALTLKNGAALQTPGLVQGGASALLDGVNDYLDTGVVTRTNKCLNPWPASIKYFAGNNSSAFSITEGHGIVATCNNAGPITFGLYYLGAGVGKRLPVKGGEEVTASALLNLNTANLSVRVRMEWYDSTGTRLTIAEGEPGTGGRLKLTAVAPAQAAEVTITFYANGGHEGDKIEWKDFLIGEGEFFPTPEQLESGWAGWAGTPNESESDIGPFARGTSRVFMGVADRQSEAARGVLVGRAGAASSMLAVEGASAVKFWPNASAGPAIWATAWPGLNQRVVWTLSFDSSTSKAELWIDGVSQGVQTIASGWPQNSNIMFLGSRGSDLWNGSMLPFLMAIAPAGEQALSGEEIARLTLVMERGGTTPPQTESPLTVDIDSYEASVEIDPYAATVELD